MPSALALGLQIDCWWDLVRLSVVISGCRTAKKNETSNHQKQHRKTFAHVNEVIHIQQE